MAAFGFLQHRVPGQAGARIALASAIGRPRWSRDLDGRQ
jgi:hypothetical protein